MGRNKNYNILSMNKVRKFMKIKYEWGIKGFIIRDAYTVYLNFKILKAD